jgi:hypothetical protein
VRLEVNRPRDAVESRIGNGGRARQAELQGYTDQEREAGRPAAADHERQYTPR